MTLFFRSLFVAFVGLMLHGGTAFGQQPKTRVTLGIKPDYMYTFKGTGVRINGLVEGGTAQKVGLRAGDIITAFDDHSIKDIFAYRDLLSQYSPGDEVKISVNRDGQRFVVPIRFK